MFIISINHNTCENCGKCASICPKAVFSLHSKTPEVNLAHRCVGCVSCVEVCPQTCIEIKEI